MPILRGLATFALVVAMCGAATAADIECDATTHCSGHGVVDGKAADAAACAAKCKCSPGYVTLETAADAQCETQCGSDGGATNAFCNKQGTAGDWKDGTCGTCVCATGKFGDRCDATDCTNANYCSNHGTAAASASTCTCSSCTGGYTGDRCAVAPIVPECGVPPTPVAACAGDVYYSAVAGTCTCKPDLGTCTGTPFYGIDGKVGCKCAAGVWGAACDEAGPCSIGTFACAHGSTKGPKEACACDVCEIGYSGATCTNVVCPTVGDPIMTATPYSDNSECHVLCKGNMGPTGPQNAATCTGACQADWTGCDATGTLATKRVAGGPTCSCLCKQGYGGTTCKCTWASVPKARRPTDWQSTTIKESDGACEFECKDANADPKKNCDCKPGFTMSADKCEKTDCSAACSGRGTLTETSVGDGTCKGTCACNTGYELPDCSKQSGTSPGNGNSAQAIANGAATAAAAAMLFLY